MATRAKTSLHSLFVGKNDCIPVPFCLPLTLRARRRHRGRPLPPPRPDPLALPRLQAASPEHSCLLRSLLCPPLSPQLRLPCSERCPFERVSNFHLHPAKDGGCGKSFAILFASLSVAALVHIRCLSLWWCRSVLFRISSRENWRYSRKRNVSFLACAFFFSRSFEPIPFNGKPLLTLTEECGREMPGKMSTGYGVATGITLRSRCKKEEMNKRRCATRRWLPAHCSTLGN